MIKYNKHAPAPKNTKEAIERSKEGSCSKALISQNQMQEVHKDALDVNEDKDEGSITAMDSAPDLIAPSPQSRRK